MTTKQAVNACRLLLVGGALLLVGCATTSGAGTTTSTTAALVAPPTGAIPTCTNCKIVMGTMNSTVSGTVTSMPARNYTSSKVVLKYANEQPHIIPVPMLNVPFNRLLTTAKLPKPVSAQIWYCYVFGGSTMCDKAPLTVQ
jgi:hypothetical protein